MQLSLWWAEAHVYKERNWTPPQWRVGVYGSTAVAGGMVFPKFGGSTATLVGRVCDLLVDSFLLLMSYQILWQFTSSHWRSGVWIITHQKLLYGYAMAEHRIMAFPKSMQSCGSCHSLILRCCVDWKGYSTPRYLLGAWDWKGTATLFERVNVITERAEHRMFHIIMLDKFGTFTFNVNRRI